MGTQKISDIAMELKMVESNVSNICSRLEKSGYIRRERQKDDQRVVKIVLTDNALPKIVDIKVEMAAFLDKMQKLMTEADLNDICVGLRKLDILLDLFLENKEQGSNHHNALSDGVKNITFPR